MNKAITRPSRLVGAAALLCLLFVQIAVAGGSGDPQATASSVKKKVNKLNRKVKNQKKQLKELENQVDEISKQAGPQGQQGQPGQNATKLFAYIRDGGGVNSDAAVQYGSGVTAVDDNGFGTYLVTFNRSLVNCVVDATSGTGNPTGTTPLQAGSRIPFINMAAGAQAGGDNQVFVVFTTDAGGASDTSFLITAFC